MINMGSSPPDAPHLRRVAAAEASGGTSHEKIYAMIEARVAQLGSRGRVLDYGAGLGHLARRLKALGRFDEVYAADIVPWQEDDETIRWICQDLNQPLHGVEDFFDLVVAAEVIEHLENPRFTVRDLYRVTKPGGHVILTTPNNESWRSLVALTLRGHFVAFSDSCYPAHITALVRRDFERIFREVGFEPLGFDFTGHGSLPKLTSVTWQHVSLGLCRGIRTSDNLLAFARKPPACSG